MLERQIVIFEASGTATCTIKVFKFLSNNTLANFVLLISSTFWVAGKALLAMQVLQISSFSANCISALLKIRKTLLRNTFMLISANKKIF